MCVRGAVVCRLYLLAVVCGLYLLPSLHTLSICLAVRMLVCPGPALARMVKRPRGTGSGGDSVGEGRHAVYGYLSVPMSCRVMNACMRARALTLTRTHARTHAHAHARTQTHERTGV